MKNRTHTKKRRVLPTRIPLPPRLRKWLRPLHRLCGVLVGALVLVVAALMVFFRVSASMREVRPREAVAPVTGHRIQTDGGEVFFQEEGPEDGPAVVFVHGTGAWSEIWRPQMDAVAREGFHAIAVDLPPFGFSEKPYPAAYGSLDQARRIVGVIDALRIDSVTLVGHSFGANATMDTAITIGDRLHAVVLVDAALAFDQPSSSWSLGKFVLSARPFRNALIASTVTNPLMTGTLLRSLLAKDETATAERIAMLQRPLSVEDSTDALGNWLMTFLYGTDPSFASDRRFYATMTVPTLLIWGERDTITPLARGEELHRLIPGSSLVTIPGSGHIPAIEDPNAVSKALIEFLSAKK